MFRVDDTWEPLKDYTDEVAAAVSAVSIKFSHVVYLPYDSSTVTNGLPEAEYALNVEGAPYRRRETGDETRRA